MLRFLIVALLACVTAGPALAVTADDAIAYIQELDANLKSAIVAARSGDLATVTRQSRAVNALEDRGRAFTSSEPLSYCYSAAVMYQHWWQLQINTSWRNGVEAVPGSISNAWSQFEDHRKSCLEGIDEVRICEKRDAKSKARCKELREPPTAPISEELKKEIKKALESDVILD